MRTDRVTRDDRIFSAKGQATWLAVLIGQPGVAWSSICDLTGLRGYSFVEKVSYQVDHDTAVATLSADIKREIFKLSLAPDLAASVLNALGGGSQLILPSKRIRVYAQNLPTGVKPSTSAPSSPWSLVFDGVIDDLNSGNDPMQVNCSDLAKLIEEHFIEDERAYGVWQPGQRYIGSATVGAVVVPGPSDPTQPNANMPNAPVGPWLRCTGTTGVAAAANWATGISTPNGTVRTPTIPNGFVYTSSGGTHNTGATEPAWSLVVGGTVVDNGIIWTCSIPTPPVWPTTINGTVSDNGMTWKCVAEAGIQLATPWAGTTSYPTGSIVTGVVAGLTWVFKNKGGTFTSGGSTPAWTATLGGTVSDNGGTWTNVGQITATPIETQIQMVLDDNLGNGTWTLFTPVASGEVIRPYTQCCESCLDAIKKIADIKAWDIRYKWDSTGSAWKLTLYDVNRANTTSAYTIGAGKYRPIASLKRDKLTLRNKIRIYFWDQISVDSSGNPVLSKIDQIDATSVGLYGTLFASVSEPAGAAINSLAAATAMGAAILSDLGMPPIDLEIVTEYAWWFEISDVITVSRDSLHFDTDQKLAIYSLAHSIAQAGDATTKYGLRGKPSTGHFRWHDTMALPGQNGGPTKSFPLAGAVTPTLTATIAGMSVAWAIPADRRYRHTEVHLSTSNGFTPGTSTLAHVGASGRKDFSPGGAGSAQTGPIVQGTTYYCRLVHKTENRSPSPHGPQASVVAGYTNFAHLNPNIVQNACGLALSTTVHSDGSNFPVTLDVENYDQGGIFDPATGIFTLVSGGTFLFVFGTVITGGAIGDQVQLAVEWWNGLTWVVQRTTPYAMFQPTGAAGAAEAWCAMSFTKGGVVAGDQFRLACYPKPATAGSTLTIVGGGFSQKAAHMSMTQLLTS